jgi:hypothetical protein
VTGSEEPGSMAECQSVNQTANMLPKSKPFGRQLLSRPRVSKATLGLFLAPILRHPVVPGRVQVLRRTSCLLPCKCVAPGQ